MRNMLLLEPAMELKMLDLQVFNEFVKWIFLEENAICVMPFLCSGER